MGFKQRLHQVLASRAEIEADEEREQSARAVGCTPVADLRDRSRVTVEPPRGAKKKLKITKIEQP